MREPPTEEQRRALIAAWQEHGDRAALAELLEAHEGLVRHIVQRFRHSGIEADDLCQEARLALVRSAGLYDLARPDSTFMSYAFNAIERRVRQYVVHYSGVTTGSEYDLRRQRARRPRDVSLDATYDDGDVKYLDELSVAPTQEQELEQAEIAAQINKAITACTRGDLRLKLVAFARLAPDEKSYAEIGEMCGVSRQAVHQWQQRLLASLHRKLERLEWMDEVLAALIEVMEGRQAC